MEQETVLLKEIDFPSSTENIALVEKLVDNVCEENGVNEDYYGNILIALTEAVNNAIVHGNRKDVNKQVRVCCESRQKEILFTVEDQGPGFDYDNLPDPTDPVNIEKPNGRGVFLMKNLADEVSFHDNGRKVELNFSLK